MVRGLCPALQLLQSRCVRNALNGPRLALKRGSGWHVKGGGAVRSITPVWLFASRLHHQRHDPPAAGSRAAGESGCDRAR